MTLFQVRSFVIRALSQQALSNEDILLLCNNSPSATSYNILDDTFVQSPTPFLDADVLLCALLQKNRSYILSHCTLLFPQKKIPRLISQIKKRRAGLPVAYIVGKKEFFGYDFFVTKSVLIPKPDTETLVELALNQIIQKITHTPSTIIKSAPNLSICDLCTGSGCVGISIMLSLYNSIPLNLFPHFTFSDISARALSIAKRNAFTLLPPELQKNISFVQSNLFKNIPNKFDFIVTNPPYVPHAQAVALLKDGRSEPLIALDGDFHSKTNDGLAIIRRLIPQAKNHLVLQGSLLMEIGEYNAKIVSVLLSQNGFNNVHLHLDLSSTPRVLTSNL